MINARTPKCISVSMVFFLLIFSFKLIGYTQDVDRKNNEAIDLAKNDEKLVNEYIKSKGQASIIKFDGANIKQFWPDETILSKNNSIMIQLENNGAGNKFSSRPEKIQLANVNEAMDCKVEVISESKDLDFSIQKNKKVLSTSQQEDNFVQYSITSSSFHLEDTRDFSFEMQFNSSEPQIRIKSILLSFSKRENSNYLESPGKYVMSEKNTKVVSAHQEAEIKKSFVVTGEKTQVVGTKKILISDSPLKMTGKIKNIGNVATRLYVGYNVYTKERILINKRNFPYNNKDTIVNVISAEKGSDTIIVDQYFEWEKNCNLVLNPKKDKSDIPSISFLNGVILDVKEIDKNQAQIKISQVLTESIPAKSQLRIHGKSGDFFYLTIKDLKPGEELELSFSTKRDNNMLAFSKEVFSKNSYYVQPIIMSYSIVQGQENSIEMQQITIDY